MEIVVLFIISTAKIWVEGTGAMDYNQDEQNDNLPVQQQTDISTAPGITYVDSQAVQSQSSESEKRNYIDDYIQQMMQKARDKSRISKAFVPSILFFLLTIVIYMGVQFVIIIEKVESIPAETELIILISVLLSAHIITLLISSKIFNEKLFSPITAKPLKPKLAFLTIIFALGVGRLVEVGVTPLYQLFPPASDPSRFFQSPQSMLLLLVYMAIIPAIFEEWLLRGMVLKYLMPFGKWTAIFVSSAIFGLMHTHPGQAIFAFAFGVMLSIIYINSGGNIWLCFIVHFTNNALSVIQSYFIITENVGALYNWLIFITVYLPIAITLVFLFYYTLKTKSPFFMPEGEIPENSFDQRPKAALRLIFNNASTYIYLSFSIFNIVSAITNVPT